MKPAKSNGHNQNGIPRCRCGAIPSGLPLAGVVTPRTRYTCPACCAKLTLKAGRRKQFLVSWSFIVGEAPNLPPSEQIPTVIN